MKSLLQCRREGKYWEDCEYTIKALSRLDLTRTEMTEKEFEDRVARFLGEQLFPGGEKFIDHRKYHDAASATAFFSSDHRPDMSIGKDGTAIEVKAADHGNKVKQAISQALFYRIGYRFVIVLLVDITDQGDIYASLREHGNTREVRFVDDLEEYMNIFVIPRLGW
ncbi:MAG: hypothetical protein JSU77_08855 [Fidelibacterota bacterium]|nr:MAG: hypothetical protein JSU77_08855 [Candidatus Neomarinimicrobiota bacterium]